MAKNPTVTGFLIGLTLFSFFVGTFGLLYADINDKYDVEYENESIATFNKLDEIHTEAETYKEEIEDIGADKNFLERGVDIIGGLVSSGISGTKIVLKSLFIFDDMLTSAGNEMSDSGIPIAGLLQKTIATIVLILLFVGILLPIILRKAEKL